MEHLGIRVHSLALFRLSSNIPLIVSDEVYGKNDYIETSRPLIIITAPGPGSGKMATCLSQLYHEHKRGVRAGYAKGDFPYLGHSSGSAQILQEAAVSHRPK